MTYSRSASAHFSFFTASLPCFRMLALSAGPALQVDAGRLHFRGTRSSELSSQTMSLTWSTLTLYVPSIAHLKKGSLIMQTPGRSTSHAGTTDSLGW